MQDLCNLKRTIFQSYVLTNETFPQADQRPTEKIDFYASTPTVTKSITIFSFNFTLPKWHQNSDTIHNLVILSSAIDSKKKKKAKKTRKINRTANSNFHFLCKYSELTDTENFLKCFEKCLFANIWFLQAFD